jgi:hypothetical protein
MVSMLTKGSPRKRGDAPAHKRDDDSHPKTKSPGPRGPGGPRGSAKAGRRRPRLDTLLLEAAKGGRTVTSITLPNGTHVVFGEGKPIEDSNPWLEELTKQ